MPILNDVCELIVDCEHKTAQPSPGGLFPLIRTPDIGLGVLKLDTAQRVDDQTYAAWTKRAAPREGDLILAREAPVGNVGIVPRGVKPVLGQRTVLIRTRASQLDPYYLNYLLSGPGLRGWMHGVSIGATVPHLNMADIRSMELPALPPLSIQRKIAAVLAPYDDLVENNSRRIRILEEMARRIYREWFVEFRYPGHQAVPAVDSDLGPIPPGWEVASLASLATVVMGQSPPSSAYNREEEGLPFHQGVGSYGEHFPVHSVYSTAGSRIAADGDILLSVRAPVGRINVANRKMILGRGLAGVAGQAAPTMFLLEALRHVFQEEDVIGSGTIFKSATRRDVESLPLVWPGENLARHFSDVVAPAWGTLRLLTTELQILRTTRDLLLPRLISGEVDVTDLDIALPEVAA